jgi:hypothetical protein
MIDTWSFGSELELAWFPMHFGKDVYIQQALLPFRRHGSSVSVESLEQF